MPTTPGDLADDLAAAVSGPEIFAVYQPQVSLESGSIVAAEALCRWRHPRLGDIDPVTMIGVAEQSGVIHALGRRMLDECLDTLAGWRETGRDWAVAVNVSPMQFEDESFADHVAGEFERRALARGSLVFELPRDLPPIDDDAMLSRVHLLREIGVEFSLAGSGDEAPSPELLRSLPVTEVKLPGELVRAAERPAPAWLREQVEVAHAHGLRVVAEGIETLTHLDTAVELGCDRAQGFLIRQPHEEITLP
ncbi:EAL domain-containing protein (putative c-di-GMP-specific phosphodiesterase class I) [Microbacterium trichothecenolyticum]|uniref:EAL domain-containing protein n=1 Tax=Microbacterium trichothecenolyticum TaxID=69370 RepID=UPI0028621811|nr:EAL domain-containing protein [Microbacterium trichothecenolyticum]MDR7185096.1 EAL domain-containing protein (putative c-di-GMP-specific phosphodiesterase class I) [Microbacterium trichothecenolyticum]